MSRNTNLLRLALLICLALPTLQAQSAWHVVKTLPVGGDGGWDYLTVDSSHNRLFVTRSSHAQAIDLDSGKVLGDITGLKQSHGTALVPRLNRGFITDGGGSGAIVVFDLSTYKILGKLAGVPDLDGIIYDAGTDSVLAVSGDGQALFSFKPDVDPQKGTIGVPIKLGGGPEFLAADGKGKVFVNLEDKSLVAKVDLAARKVIARWPLAPGGHPTGMSIDVAAKRLFIGGRNPKMLVVMSTETGAVEASFPIGAGVDATALLGSEAFASCADGTLTVVSASNGKFGSAQTVQTHQGSRTMAVDAAHHRLYLPAADFEPATTGWPKVKPGTFRLLVLESK
jgi:DNA-binding beta-propeller fold protein YncE